jgi:hypothetical protein
VIEKATVAQTRGTSILAQLVTRQSDNGPRLQGFPNPTNATRALVVAAYDDKRLAEALRDSNWENVGRRGISHRAGEHEALGAIALVAAVQAIAANEADEVLVVAIAEGRFEAFLFAAP